MSKILNDAAFYSSERVSLKELTIENYVTTDNLLQNKLGKVNAEKLPPQEGNVTKFSKGDILISNIRPYLKKIWLAKCEGGSSADVLTLKVKPKFDSTFIYYSLFRDDFFDYVMNGAKGTKMPRGDKKQILEFHIPHFEKSNQQKIAKVLSDLDAKIELNNKINAELEAMAKTLYDYWFVQFDFPFDFAQDKPSENGKPYKSSGGKMVWNEELKRNIPEGWEVKKTEDLVADIKTGLNPREHFKLGGGLNYYITIKNIEYGRISFDNSCDRIDDDAMERIQKRSNLEKGDILFTSIEPVGKTYLLSEKPINWNINESVFSFKPNYDLVSSEYLFMLISSKGFNDLCKNASTGSIHKGIRITPMKAFKICHPNNKNLILEFTKIVSPYLKFIDKNQKENQELASLRDWLLPMLMNGQVTVASTGSATEKGYGVEAKEQLGMVAEPELEYHKIEKESKEDRFELWLSNQKLAARGDIDEVVLRDIFNAMDNEDK